MLSTDARRLVAILILPWLVPLVILPFASDWNWFDGWVWIAQLIMFMYALCLYLYFKDPVLLEERMKTRSADQVPIDKILTQLLGLLFMSWFFVIPTDVKRYQWSLAFTRFIGVHSLLKWISFGFASFGLYVTFRSFSDCTFLSPILRIQKERNQKVIDTGSFGIVRHPMYSGLMQYLFFMTIFLGSFCAFVIVALIFTVLLVRVHFEEEMLETNLDGYREYKKRVQFKFIPYVL